MLVARFYDNILRLASETIVGTCLRSLCLIEIKPPMRLRSWTYSSGTIESKPLLNDCLHAFVCSAAWCLLLSPFAVSLLFCQEIRPLLRSTQLYIFPLQGEFIPDLSVDFSGSFTISRISIPMNPLNIINFFGSCWFLVDLFICAE